LTPLQAFVSTAPNPAGNLADGFRSGCIVAQAKVISQYISTIRRRPIPRRIPVVAVTPPPEVRDLIMDDQSPFLAAGLSLFGLVVTFGGVATGTAIMAIGRGNRSGN